MVGSEVECGVAAGEQGWSVHLWGAHDHLGGRRTSNGPYRANWGPHVVYSDGPLWAWLDERNLTAGARSAPRLARVVVRINGRSRRVPPIGLLRAIAAIRRATPPVDAGFREWATGCDGRSSASARSWASSRSTTTRAGSRPFVHERLRRATSFPPTVRYLPGGWSTMIDRLADRARALGARIETSAPVDAPAGRTDDPRGPDARPRSCSARRLRVGGDDDRVAGSRTGSSAHGSLRGVGPGPPGFCETFTVADPSLAPAGQHLVQTQAGMRPDETLDAAVAHSRHWSIPRTSDGETARPGGVARASSTRREHSTSPDARGAIVPRCSRPRASGW